MRRIARRWLGILSLQFLLAAQPASAADFISSEHHVETVDGRTLTYCLDRPAGESDIPVIVVIDGSGCVGARRPGFEQLMAPSENPGKSFARLVVGKTGVPPEKRYSEDCSDEFLQAYSIDERVFDHMRVLQDFRQKSDWWNGQTLVFGWSDGGDIAAQLFAYSPQISRLAFGGVGGGFTMREHFEDFWVCPRDQDKDRTQCLRNLEQKFAEVLRNPSWGKTWSGQDNSYKAWESRLSTRLTPILRSETRPVLMVHGAEEIDGAPVASARKLHEDLRSQQTQGFTYWEVAGMEHSLSSLPADKALTLETAILDWLLGQVVAQPKL